MTDPGMPPCEMSAFPALAEVEQVDQATATEQHRNPRPRRAGQRAAQCQHEVCRVSAGKETVHGGDRAGQTRASPSRCAMSLRKMRTWAIGFLRTSSLFM